ncbi:MAG: hypothetical protein AAB902_02615 [Patescibacteria group bacterium]
MQRLDYALKTYIKAVEILAKTKGFSKIEFHSKSGSAVRFEAFVGNDTVPHSMWVVHVLHDKRKTIYSKEDYRKVTVNLVCTMEEFLEVLKQC